MRSKALPFLLLVLIHLLSNLQMEQPIIMADELGYLGNARYLAGRAPLPNLEGARFYHFGYSLLLVPAFWLFASPVWAYKATLILNALLLSSLYFPLTSMLERVLETPGRVAGWIAFTCCLYPPFVLFSNFAWSENAFIPLYVGAAVLFGSYLSTRSSRDALLFGLAIGLLYTIHPRALPVVVFSVAYLFLLAVLGIAARRQVLFSTASMAAILVATRLVNEHLEASAWGGTGELSAANLASRVLPGGQFISLILRAAGQLLYLALSTHGLFLLGLIVMSGILLRLLASQSPRRLLADPVAGLLIFLLGSGGGIFLASTALKVYSLFGRNTLRAANFIYGRYNEAIAVVVMAVALAYLWRCELKGSQLARQTLAVGALLLLLTVVVMYQIQIASDAVGPEVPWLVDAPNIGGIFPLVELLGMPRLYWVSLIALGSYLTIIMLMRRFSRAAMVLLMVLFSCTSLYIARFNVQPAVEANRARLSFVPQISRLGPIETLDYDLAYRDYKVFYGAQFLMQETVFERFDSRQGEEPTSEVVISGKDWSQTQRLDARFVVSAAAGNTALWVLPGEMQSRLPIPQFEDVNLGVEPRWGVLDSGFYPPEPYAGVKARWTNGAASLRVPVAPGNPPRWLTIGTIATGRNGVRLQILANGIELWNEWIPEAWSKTFSLEQVPIGEMITLELVSDTINPYREVVGSNDNRDLGVLVRDIRLKTRESRDPASFVGETLGAESVEGVDESGFYLPELFDEAPARWTNGAAKLRVPLDPLNLPQGLEIEVSAPGRDGIRLQVLANGVELWNERVPDQGTSATLALDRVPLEQSLTLELNCEPFIPSESFPGSTDSRTLGVVVKGIRLTR